MFFHCPTYLCQGIVGHGAGQGLWSWACMEGISLWYARHSLVARRHHGKPQPHTLDNFWGQGRDNPEQDVGLQMGLALQGPWLNKAE